MLKLGRGGGSQKLINGRESFQRISTSLLLSPFLTLEVCVSRQQSLEEYWRIKIMQWIVSYYFILAMGSFYCWWTGMKTLLSRKREWSTFLWLFKLKCWFELDARPIFTNYLGLTVFFKFYLWNIDFLEWKVILIHRKYILS